MKNAFDGNVNIGRDDAFEQELACLGGEAKLKLHYPELYRVLLYSHKKQKESIVNNSIPFHLDADENADGLVNAIDISALEYAAETDARMTARASMTTMQKSLVLIGTLRDDAEARTLASFAKMRNNIYKIEGTAICESNEMVKTDSMRFHATAKVARIILDNDGKPFYQTETVKEDAIKTLGGSPIIKDGIKISDPIPCRHPGNNKTVIFYNNRKGDECDYYYANVPTGSGKIEVHVPFSGEVFFQDGLIAEYVDKNEGFNYYLLPGGGKGGAVYFDTSLWKDIKWEKHSENGIKWTFPDAWGRWMNTELINADFNVSFFCKMSIHVSSKNGDSFNVPITINSADPSNGDPSHCEICMIQIEWGCFAKGTRITMADGTLKKIEDISKGEMVKSKNGTSSVEEIVTGTEKEMVLIVTETGKRICLTSNHPVLTNRGWKAAITVTAADKLMTIDGEERIEELHMQEYNDAVYSLKIGEDDAIIAEGIYTGDFRRQNMAEKREALPVKKEAYQEELEELIGSMDKEMRESDTQ